MAKSRLKGAVCRQRTEMWPTVCYMNLSVDRDVNCGKKYVT